MNDSIPIKSSNLLSSFFLWFERQQRWLAWLELLIVLIFIGWVDCLTGWEWSMFVLYVIPIVLAVRIGGFSGGLVASGLSGVVWWVANRSGNPYQTTLGYSIAMASRMIYFAIAAVATSALRARHEADALRIKMLEERRQLEHDIVEVSEHEQQRIGRDLHDGLCQQLAAIGCAMRALADELRPTNGTAAEDIGHVEEMVRDAITEARSLAHGIFPVHVDRLGLSTALADLAEATTRLTGVPVRTVESGTLQQLTPEAAMHLYRIAQEAAANAVKHSGGHEVAICLHARDHKLDLRVEDDGKGIEEGDMLKPRGMGLRTMQYRAQALGTELQIKPRPGGGTAVQCCITIPPTPQHNGHT